MAKKAIEREFRTSNMADRSEMQSKVIFGHPKWLPKKFLYQSEMARILRSKVNLGNPRGLSA